MTATPPPASGDSPTSDRRVTILAACSLLCTVIALVCLGLLVFTGDTDADATTASTNEATNESTDEEPSAPESSHPDDLTPAGWNSSNVQCKGNDSWIYAATGATGKVLVCLHEEIPYLVDDNGAPDNVDSVWPMCPARGHDPELGRFTVAYGVDGWQQLDGLTMYYYMYMSTGQRSPEGAGDPANVDVTHFDGYWVNDIVDYSDLDSCGPNNMSKDFVENPDQEEPSLSTDSSVTASDEHGGLDLGPNGDGAGAVSPTGKTIAMCEFGLPAGTTGRAEFSDGTEDFDPVCERIRDEFYAERPYICGESDGTGATAEECEARGQEPLLVYDQPQSLWGNDPRSAPNPL